MAFVAARDRGLSWPDPAKVNAAMRRVTLMNKKSVWYWMCSAEEISHVPIAPWEPVDQVNLDRAMVENFNFLFEGGDFQPT
jgi:hypothetical protein